MKRDETESGIILTKLSSKGQLVIPKDLRKRLGIKEGDLLALTQTKEGLIALKKIKSPILKEDLITLHEIGKAWREIEKGKFKQMRTEDFFKELAKW